MVDHGFDYALTMSRIVILLLLLSVFGSVQAKIYKWVLPDGRILYSDRPQEADAEELKLKPLQTYEAPKLPTGNSTAKPKTPLATKYTEFGFLQPEPDASLRDDGGTVSISLRLQPGLGADHSIDILMDGKVLGSGRTTGLELQNVDRGSHTLRAVIKDQAGKELAQTSPVTFHLLKHGKAKATGSSGGGAVGGSGAVTGGGAAAGGAATN